MIRAIRSEYFILALSVAYFGALAPFTPGLASPGNLANILSSLMPLLVVALGQTCVLIAGGIDLSVTSIIALTSVVGAMVMNSETGWLHASAGAVPAGLVTMLVVGALIGAGNGCAIAWLRMPPFIVTLTAMMFYSGFAIWLTQSKNVAGLPAAFNTIGGGTAGALSITLVVLGLTQLVLSRTLYGRWLYAVGHNPKAAHVSGVPVRGVVVAVYVLSGICAGVASILYTGRLETGSPVLGQRILLDVIGATVIGGTSLYGGKGKVLWTICGALFLTLLDNSLNLLSLSYFTIMMVKGGVILLAALFDTLRHQQVAA